MCTKSQKSGRYPGDFPQSLDGASKDAQNPSFTLFFFFLSGRARIYPGDLVTLHCNPTQLVPQTIGRFPNMLVVTAGQSVVNWPTR